MKKRLHQLIEKIFNKQDEDLRHAVCLGTGTLYLKADKNLEKTHNYAILYAISESEDEFYQIALDVMGSMLKPYHIAVMSTRYGSAERMYDKNNRLTDDAYLRYAASPYTYGLGNQTFTDDGIRIISSSKNLSHDLAALFLSRGTDGSFTYLNVWAYDRCPYFNSFSQAEAYVKEQKYAVQFRLSSHPDCLDIIYDKRIFTFEGIEKLAKEACQKYNKCFIMEETLNDDIK